MGIWIVDSLKKGKIYKVCLFPNNTGIVFKNSKMMRMCNVVNEWQKKNKFNGNNSQNSLSYPIYRRQTQPITSKTFQTITKVLMDMPVINKKMNHRDIIPEMYSINKLSIGNYGVRVGG